MELKRGFFFSMISLLLLIGLFFLAQPRIYESTLMIERTSQERIFFTNNAIQNFEQGFLSRALESQTIIVLEAITEHLNTTGSLYTSREELEANFTNALITGDIGGTDVKALLPVEFENASRSLAQLLELYANASGQNHNLNFSFSDDPDDYAVRLFQDDLTGPWQVGVEITIAYNVTPGLPVLASPGEEIARWTLNRSVITYANIRGVRDPYLYVRSEGTIQAPITEFFTERWNRNAFEMFVDSGGYYPTNASMSLLGRYYDSMEFSTCCGMLTTINETRYGDYNDHLVPGNFSNVTFLDCGYFPASPVTPLCRREGDVRVYAVEGISQGYITDLGGAITTDPTSTFPFSIGGKTGPEVFNLTFSDDLRRILVFG